MIKLLPVYQNSIIEQYNHYAVLWFGGYAPESIGDLLKSINLQSIFTTTL
ncbi:MAG: hypothetical protein LBF15_03060 [Candidatus Peribacteria bacterium]|nr:hypothetical protein [Candidatus Peribacteria bacterium]